MNANFSGGAIARHNGRPQLLHREPLVLKGLGLLLRVLDEPR